MREIKFRGKRKNNGEWVVGYYAYKDLSDEHFIIAPTFDAHSEKRPQYFTDNLVEPKTVGQFAGLKDKNDKEVYEGDVIRSEAFPNRIGENYAIEDLAEFHYLAIDLAMGPNDVEIIGNMHENPELLK